MGVTATDLAHIPMSADLGATLARGSDSPRRRVRRKCRLSICSGRSATIPTRSQFSMRAISLERLRADVTARAFQAACKVRPYPRRSRHIGGRQAYSGSRRRRGTGQPQARYQRRHRARRHRRRRAQQAAEIFQAHGLNFDAHPCLAVGPGAGARAFLPGSGRRRRSRPRPRARAVAIYAIAAGNHERYAALGAAAACCRARDRGKGEKAPHAHRPRPAPPTQPPAATLDTTGRKASSRCSGRRKSRGVACWCSANRDGRQRAIGTAPAPAPALPSSARVRRPCPRPPLIRLAVSVASGSATAGSGSHPAPEHKPAWQPRALGSDPDIRTSSARGKARPVRRRSLRPRRCQAMHPQGAPSQARAPVLRFRRGPHKPAAEPQQQPSLAGWVRRRSSGRSEVQTNGAASQ